MPKPIVHYNPNPYYRIYLGQSAVVFPIDHPSGLVSNTKPVLTSSVIKIDKGEGQIIGFETQNTQYKRKESQTTKF